jgi:hypothetical protein
MKKLLVTTFVFGIVLAARATPARADFGIGLFLGDPSGLDLKIGLTNRTGLDIVLGFDTFRDGRADYGHLTYLVTPFVAHGDSVLVPIRFGIGAALYGGSGDLDLAVRAPFELAFRLRNAPLEFYGELAVAFTLFDPHEDALQADLQGGLGFRVFF